ncbi:MAG: site-specific integrase [Syntrophorhabdaceae bacterium]|nr:site-specific integrase [Syntrophorhabdaceae bacterium]
MSELSLSTTEATEIDIRGCLSKPKKSQFYSAVLQWKDSHGEPHRISKTTKKAKLHEAHVEMARMIEELKEELRTASPGTVFVDFLKHWLETVIVHEVEETTYVGYQLNMSNHIIPYFEPLKLRIKDVRPVHITQFMEYKIKYGSEKSGPLKAGSVSRYYANLKTAFDYTMKEELVFSNPARLVKPPKDSPENKFVAQWLSFEEITRLWKVAKSDIAFPAIFLASIYGFRRGEVCGLKWPLVRFESRIMQIFETRTRSNREITKGTKNKPSRRSMPIMEAVEQYLRLLQMQQEERREFCGNSWIDSGYVVANEIGEPLSFNTIQKNYKKLLKQCGLPDVRFHDLRHSVATYLLEIGIPIEEVSAWLGHSSIATTAKVYAHVNIGIRRNAAKTLDKLLGFQETEKKAESIERALSEMFRELLESIRAEIEERKAGSVRTLENPVKNEAETAKKPFEVSFEPALVSPV